MPKQWDVTSSMDIITRIYDQIQEREPDENGKMYWSAFLVNGEQSVKNVMWYISQSDEYKGRFITGQPVEQAVQTCYKHFLGRVADDGGLHYYTQIAEKDGIPTVIDLLMKSEEYQRNFGDDGVPPKVK